jgi:hypothetical protein
MLLNLQLGLLIDLFFGRATTLLDVRDRERLNHLVFGMLFDSLLVEIFFIRRSQVIAFGVFLEENSGLGI